MLAETSNVTVSVLRGTSVNQWGDVVDDLTPAFEHVRATLVETSKEIQDPSTQTPRTIREIICWVPEFLGVTTDDRIKDEVSGLTYMIAGIMKPPTIVRMNLPVQLNLKRVSGNNA